MKRVRTVLGMCLVAALCGLVVHRVGALLTSANEDADVTFPTLGQHLAYMTPNPFYVTSSHSVTFTKSGQVQDTDGFRFTNGFSGNGYGETQTGIATGGYTWPTYASGSHTYADPVTGYYDTGLLNGNYNAFARTYRSINGTESLMAQDDPGFVVDP
jgi:hypothetical protein